MEYVYVVGNILYMHLRTNHSISLKRFVQRHKTFFHSYCFLQQIYLTDRLYHIFRPIVTIFRIPNNDLSKEGSALSSGI